MLRFIIAFLAAMALAQGAAQAKVPHVGARAAILVEAKTGRILFEQRAFERRPPASTTKILTAYLAVRHLPLDEVLQVSRRAAATPGSSAHLRAGEHYRVDELLKGMLLRSGNDAASVFAEAVSGDEARFSALMQQTAERMGAHNSYFENPHGLTRPDHFSTAHDLSLLARRALALVPVAQVVALKDATFESVEGRCRPVHNTNRLLEDMPDADGVKTGTTSAAGKCLVASATRDGMHLVAVVLKSPDRWGDARRLLEWGFSEFEVKDVAAAGQEVTRVRMGRHKVPLVAARPLVAVLPKGAEARVELRLRPRRLMAPEGAPLAVMAVVGREGPYAFTFLTRRPHPRSSWQIAVGRAFGFLRRFGLVQGALRQEAG